MTQAVPVYRVRSQQIWDLARDDYLAGEPARIVCRRYDLGLSAFRIRARKAGWRRQDQDDPDLYDPAWRSRRSRMSPFPTWRPRRAVVCSWP